MAAPADRLGVFDAQRPPAPERIADCVHCGFCLPACPTYALWGQEMDSPRGRIHLMKLGLTGEIALDETFVGHFDACLGCMACLTACPSGVRYDELIAATRAQIERHWERTPAERRLRRLIFALFPYPRRLRAAALLGWAYQRLRIGALLRRSGLLDRLPARVRALEALLPAVSLRALARRTPALTPAAGSTRLRAGLLTGCVQSVFFGDCNQASARVLAAEGCEVTAPPAQGCCGALALHAGEEAAAQAKAKALIAVFERSCVDVVVATAAGCGSAMKEYGHLLRDEGGWAERAAAFSAKVRDVTELLGALEPRAERHRLAYAPGAGLTFAPGAGLTFAPGAGLTFAPGAGLRPAAGGPVRVAYHDACHLGHAQGVRAQPRALLGAIPGVELVPIAEPELCCGSAGVYNLLQPEPAQELGRRKAAHVAAAGADLIATANPGCLLQLRRYLPEARLVHPVEILDWSIQGKACPW